MKRLALILSLAAGVGFAAAPEEFSTSAGTLRLTPIQHASLMIQAGGKVMYVDPAMGSYDGLPAADYILISHIHADHMAPAVVNKLRKPGTVILGPKTVAASVTGCTVISNGESRTLGPFVVEAVPAYNLKPSPSGEFFHPKGRDNGYVVTYGGKRFYFSADTEGVPEMRALKHIDVAFICMNQPYTMLPQDAADAVRAFHPAVVYPYHYRGTDLAVFTKALEGSGIEVRLRDWYAK